jgi:hypothetical protein
MAGVVQRMINREARLWGMTLTSPLFLLVGEKAAFY